MSDQDNLRGRIAGVLRRHKLSHPKGGTAAGAWCECSCGTVETTSSRDHAELLAQRHQAQAIIDEFGMTAHGDDCGYHEIHGSYDTRFEDWEKQ